MGYRRHTSNPCQNTQGYRTMPKERFLTADQMVRLDAELTRDDAGLHGLRLHDLRYRGELHRPAVTRRLSVSPSARRCPIRPTCSVAVLRVRLSPKDGSDFWLCPRIAEAQGDIQGKESVRPGRGRAATRDL